MSSIVPLQASEPRPIDTDNVQVFRETNLMSGLLPLGDGLDADVIGEFVTSVDWSEADPQRPAIADVVGRLESWTVISSKVRYVNKTT